MTSSYQVIQIKKAVFDNTIAEDSLSPEAVKNLLKFLNNRQTVDVVYEKIMERAQSDKTAQNPLILLRCVALLKTYVPKYPPGMATLRGLNTFCQTIGSSGEGSLRTALVKSVSYIRALIRKQLEGSTGGSNEIDTSRSGSGIGATTTADVVPKLEVQTSRSPVAQEDGLLIANFLPLRKQPAAFPSKPLSGHLLLCNTFGGQFRKSPSAADVSTRGPGVPSEIDLKDALQVTDVELTEQRIQTVGSSKKKEEGAKYGMRDVHRKALQLFHYKFYSDQEQLAITFKEMDQVVDTVTSASADEETRQMASKVLIKLFMDIYRMGDANSSLEILSIFFEMVSKDVVDARVHAFNLLFNMSVHANLYEEGAFHSSMLETPRPGSETSNIWGIQEDLYDKLLEVLLFILHREEKDERVWTAAVNCFLYFVSNKGFIDKKRVNKLDPRLIPSFLSIPLLSDEVQRKLLRMLVNFLYPHGKTSSLSLDVLVLDRIGGIRFVIREYVSTRSTEVRHNLFMVIFDYAVHMLSQRKMLQPLDEQMSIIFELMKQFRAAEVLPQVFKVMPEKFVENLVRFMFFEQMRRDASLNDVSYKLDKTLIVAFLYELEKLASQHQRMSVEFEVRLQAMLTQGDAKGEHLAVLQALLDSDTESDRMNGEAWLFALFRAQLEGNKVPAEVFAKVEELFGSLVTSPRATTRWCYISVTERLVILHKFQLQGGQGDESRLATIFRLLNRNLSKVVMAHEKNEANLAYMFDVMANFMSIRAGTLPEDPYSEQLADSTCGLFLSGHLIIPLYILKYINLSIFYHLFINMSPRTAADMRVTLLFLIIEKCRNKTLFDSIGGIKFFRELLGDRDPRIAYHASRFLLEQLMAEKPDQYRSFLHHLICKAQQTNDEKLLENPYLQIKAIMEIAS